MKDKDHDKDDVPPAPAVTYPRLLWSEDDQEVTAHSESEYHDYLKKGYVEVRGTVAPHSSKSAPPHHRPADKAHKAKKS